MKIRKYTFPEKGYVRDICIYVDGAFDRIRVNFNLLHDRLTSDYIYYLKSGSQSLRICQTYITLR